MQRRQFSIDQRQAGLDENGQPLPAPVLPKQLTQIVPLNKGRGGAPSAQDNASHDLALADYYDAHGRPDLAKQRRDTAAQYGLMDQRTAAASLSGARGAEITQGKIPLDVARANEAQAHGTYYRQLIGVDMARIRATVTTARGHDATRVQVAGQQAAASLQRANVSANSQEEGRLLAGYFTMQGHNESDAVRLAVTTAQDAERYAQAQGAQTKSWDPSKIQPAVMPDVTVNVGQGGSGDPMAFATTLAKAFATARESGKPVDVAAAVKAATAAQHGKNLRVPAAHEVARGRAAGASDDVIRTRLLQHGYTQAEVDAALPLALSPPPLNPLQGAVQGVEGWWKQHFGHGPPTQPLPIGGSKAAPPFPGQ